MVFSSELGTEHKSRIRGTVQIPLFCAWLLLETSSVQAQDSPKGKKGSSVDLVWIAPEACPRRSALIAEIEELVGRPLHTISRPSIKATATVRKKDNETWVLRLRTREQSATGERELVADSCETLAQATALILALSIDPKAVETRERLYDQARRLTKGTTPSSRLDDVTEREEGAAERRYTPESTEPSSDEETMDLTYDWRFDSDEEDDWFRSLSLDFLFRSGLVGDLGTLPNASIGADAAVGLTIKRLDFVVSLNWLLPNETTLPTRPEYGARFGLWTIGLGVYYSAFVSELSLAPYVIIDIGSMYGEGTGVSTSLEDSAFWLSMAAGFRISWEFTNWAAIGFEIGPKVPFFRHRYVLEISDAPERVYRSSPVAMCIRMGFELRL